MVIPDRWLEYSSIGDVIPGTRFIAFKVPLRETVRLPDDQKHTTKHVLEGIPDGNQLGMVINLTNTKSDRKYYEPDDWNMDADSNIEYHRVKVEGRVVPDRAVLIRFFEHVNEFLKKDSERLIGVHCTHGVNRTGLFLVAHMIIFQSMSPREAIEKFTRGRGHAIERHNYIEYLKRLPSLMAKGETFTPDDIDRISPRFERNGRSRSREFKRKWEPDHVDHDDDYYATNSWRNHDAPDGRYPKKPKHPRSYYSNRNKEGHYSRYENDYREHDRYRNSPPKSNGRRYNPDNFTRDLDLTDRPPYTDYSSMHSRNATRTEWYPRNSHNYDINTATPHPSTLAGPPSYNSHHKKWVNPNLQKK